ncbi:MAG: VOC family protein [Betaproteobacteria bacterium]|nr:VOC family protein [Betaproteobacteria bacterium]
MTMRLDHIVIAVADLARAVEDYRALGFTVQIGGRHPGRTSHNALVVFEDGAYLELIAWEAPGPAERWYNTHATHGDGFMDFALVPEDTASAIAGAKARGLVLDGPLDGGRVRPDGRQVKWQTGRQATFDLPFLCGDITPRELRVPTGEVRCHANGALGVAKVAVAVEDLKASLPRYRALLGIDPGSGGQGGIRIDSPVLLPKKGIRAAVITLGETALVLMTPSGSATADKDPVAQALRERLASRGEGPCAMSLRTSAGHKACTLDRALAHDATIEMFPVGDVTSRQGAAGIVRRESQGDW